MKRILSIALAALVSFSVALPAEAARPQKFCGDLCVQTTYKSSAEKAFFLNGRDGMVHASSSGFTVFSTFSQKKLFTYTVPRGRMLFHIERSWNSDWVVVALDNGEVYRFSSYNWAKVLIKSTGLADNQIDQIAIENSGENVYVAYQTDSPTPSRIRRYLDGDLTETFVSTDDDYGIFDLVVDSGDEGVYVGFNGAAPTIIRLDAGNIDAGATASDVRDDMWEIWSIAVASNGSVYGANSGYPGSSPLDTEETTKIVKFNGTSLTTENRATNLDDWGAYYIALSADEESLFAVASYSSSNSTLGEKPNTLTEYNANTLDFVRELELPEIEQGTRFSYIDSDESGRYLLLTTEDSRVRLITLDDSPLVPDASFSASGSGNAVGWTYAYLNPKAKFKHFEVKYTPANKRKAKVKLVKRDRQTMIGAIKPGTRIQVRAVYTNRAYNSAWADATEVL